MANWREHIAQEPEHMDGRPYFKGTRLTVQFVLERMADGWPEADLLHSYPRLTRDHLSAALAYAAETLDVEQQLLVDKQ